MQDVSLAIVLAATILALYRRPRQVPDWAVAATGAAVAWLLGPLGLRGGMEAVGDSGNIVAFFLGLMLIAAGAEAAGLYARAAMLLSQRTTTRARVAFVLIAGLVITAVLSNDATPLVLTPAVFAAGAALAPETRRTALAATFTADGASLLLPVSNPVNLLFFERFEMGFGEYAGTITPAAVAGILAMALILWKRAPEQTVQPAARERIAARNVGPALFVVGTLAVAYVAGGVAGVPLGLVTVGGGFGMLLAARLTGPIDGRAVARHLSPGVLVFVASLLLLVENVSAAGTLGGVSEALEWLGEQPTLVTVFGAAAVAAALSNLMNNWPAALLLVAAIAGVDHNADELVAGALIGSTIGANFTTLGSLSTVFWANLARQSGAHFGHGEYARAAFVPTLAGVSAASLVAALLV